jgi:hypothetical protein
MDGHLEVLMWAQVHGCPWDKWTVQVPLKAGI